MINQDLKISVITCSLNSEKTIRSTMESLANQSYKNVEHIVIDGGSSDSTLEIIREYPHVHTLVSEKDSGMYDAMNKGIKISSGDYIGILNADDYYTNNNSLHAIGEALLLNPTDSIFADVVFVSRNDIKKVVRYYSSNKWNPEKFEWGYMPAHPSFYVKKEHFDKLGLYKTDYKICADYELLIRFLFNSRISYQYLEQCIVTMRSGGISNSSIGNRILLNREIVRACRENNINTNLLKLSLKGFSKLKEYIIKPK